jgi:hypothetical protein
MSHFAKIENGIVTEVHVAEWETLQLGHWGDPSLFVQTSYNTRGGVHSGGGTPLRGNYAGIGYIYDKENDVFYPPRPIDNKGVVCDSWTIGAPDWMWKNPIPKPDDADTGTPKKLYAWDETTKSWIIPPVPDMPNLNAGAPTLEEILAGSNPSTGA